MATKTSPSRRSSSRASSTRRAPSRKRATKRRSPQRRKAPQKTPVRQILSPHARDALGIFLVVLALALLFFGPSKLPQLGASLGEAIRGFKKGINSIGDDEKEQEKLPPPPAS